MDTPCGPKILHLSDRQWGNLWKKVRPTGFCWEWTANRCRKGYGRFNLGGKQQQAHRVVYEVLVGLIPEGLEIDHLCRNKACVNPDHLEPVTGSENMKRVPGKPFWVFSGKHVTGFCRQGHEYTDENTYTYPDGRTECRTCKRAHKRRQRAEDEVL